MPDGSRIFVPESDAPTPGVPSRNAPPSYQPSEQVRQFLRVIGKRGGQARARNHSREEIAAWGAARRNKAAKYRAKIESARAKEQEVSSQLL